MERRLALTDFQKIIVYLAVVAAVFLAAMALGQWSLLLLFAGIGVLVVVVLGAFAIQMRRQTGGREIATAKVLSVSAVPANAGIAANCSMKLAVQVPGRGLVETKVRVNGLALSRWPSRGQTVPVEFTGSPQRGLQIRWDMVEAGMVRAPDSTRPAGGPKADPAAAGDMPVWENGVPPVLYSPTPPRPRKPTTYASASRSAPPAAPEPPPPPPPHLFEEFTDLDEEFPEFDEETVRASAPPDEATEAGQRRLPLPMPPIPDAETNGHDPDGLDLADFEEPRLAFEEPRLERVVLPDFDPAEIDRSDFFDAGDDEPTERSVPEEPARPIPQPRDPADPTRGGTGLDASLGVTDLARSLRFYRDTLGFAVAHAGPDSAVVEFAGTRILLQAGGDPAEGVATVHVEVSDIEETCAQLRARGIEIVLPPMATGGGGQAQLWRARLRDPDGHQVELVEWREEPR